MKKVVLTSVKSLSGKRKTIIKAFSNDDITPGDLDESP